MDSRKLEEAIAGLPQSINPYAPSERPDVDMASELKPATAEELPKPEEPISAEQPIEPEPTPEAPEEPSFTPSPIPPPTPKGPVWEKKVLPNKKDIGFERSDGFGLRIRRIESVTGKHLAQIWKDDEVLEKGYVMVPLGEDPVKYIQGMADAMLNDGSERDEDEEEELPKPEKEEEQYEAELGAVETEEELEGEELGDIDMEISEEDLPT